jgi:hypothetical protein
MTKTKTACNQHLIDWTILRTDEVGRNESHGSIGEGYILIGHEQALLIGNGGRVVMNVFLAKGADMHFFTRLREAFGTLVSLSAEAEDMRDFVCEEPDFGNFRVPKIVLTGRLSLKALTGFALSVGQALHDLDMRRGD